MRRLSVAHLTAINLPPPALIEAAAAAGFDAVGLRLLRVTPESPGYPLMEDAPLLRATKAALRATGIAVNDIEFIKLTPETSIPTLLPMLDAGAELGATSVITAPYDEDHDRLADTLAALSEAARDRGLTALLEFFPWTTVPDLATCTRIVEAAGPHTGLLVDSLHFNRSNSRLADLAALPPARLPVAHLCDAPVAPPYSVDALLHTAREARLPPGEGQIPLEPFLAALPANLPLGLEIPMPAAAMADGPIALLKRLHTATRTLLA